MPFYIHGVLISVKFCSMVHNHGDKIVPGESQGLDIIPVQFQGGERVSIKFAAKICLAGYGAGKIVL